ncbi:MAG: hypothetical protein GF405_09280 [Candidatus Eisenbacteria bacterium]|nr:hypothetical protein [Candidatus Eisenbacteria bacterium]
MTVLTHMAVGAAAGSFVEGRLSAAALGAAIHVPLDLIPHYEFQKLWLEVVIVAAAFGAMLVAGLWRAPVFWGAAGAILPDVENLLWRLGILPGHRKVFPGHSEKLARWLPHGRELPVRHAWWQAVLAGAAVVVATVNTRS